MDVEEDIQENDPLDEVNLERIEAVLDEIDDKCRSENQEERRPSVYLRIFEEMINIVNEYEYCLLSEEEWDVIGKFSHISYNSRFLLARLALRKPGQWYSVPKLQNLKKEVGEGLVEAIDELTYTKTSFDTSSPEVEMDAEPDIKQEPEPDRIDLTLDSDEDFAPASSSEPSSTTTTPSSSPPNTPSHDYSYFCQNEKVMTLLELLNCLKVEQLKAVAKEMKVKVGKLTKAEIIALLINRSSKQSTIPFETSPVKKPTNSSNLRQSTLGFIIRSKHPQPPPLRQNKLPFKPIKPSSQELVLRGLALKQLTKCVRLNPDIFDLLMRINIIAFRSTELPKSIALPALLTAFKKRTYTRYAFKRTTGVWASRDDFLDYYKALQIHECIESLIDQQVPLSSSPSTDKPPPATPNPAKALATPAKTSAKSPIKGSAKSLVASSSRKKLDDEVDGDYEEIPEDSPRQARGKQVKELFVQEIYPKWRVLLTLRNAKALVEPKDDVEPSRIGLERFESGYVYTRMVSKATESFGPLKDYKLEYRIIEELLKQKVWLRGKRAKWYERRAILISRYMWDIFDDIAKEDGLSRTREGVVEALNDEDTVLVYRPSLFRRLERLEKQLHIPEAERSKCEGQLSKPKVVELEALRVRTRNGNKFLFDANGQHIPHTEDKDKENSVIPATPAKRTYHQMTLMDTPQSARSRGLAALITPSPSCSQTSPSKTKHPVAKWIGKSVWVGRGGDEVNVETRALQYYERQGFKGFHSETGILTTLFALLFWDIIFWDVPGAFETPYQTEPLDLRDEIFYYARKDIVDVRLKEIRGGWAKDIIEKHDKMHREKKTWCVGMSWDLCECSDLIEIAECLGGTALAGICRLFCEDYNGRSSGVPDLIVWNPTKKECKFVEVKGPGDTERENQKLWMDALLNVGVGVELCRIFESGKPPTGKGKSKATPKTVPHSGERVSSSKSNSVAASSCKQATDKDISIVIDSDARVGPLTADNKVDGWDEDEEDDELPVHSSLRLPISTPISPDSPRERVVFDCVELPDSPRKKRRLSP
ncbi:hypothetical protein BDN71DRAFT_1447067 [Pleurotus eryngii]|uniref:Fanconi-associated nuclease n=1 Tax=Pleurotus eryngii TaxID=5323 RepID=A0A9P6D7K0_PLEER|nr:hypothetical protein BDN71DRAFT_1447067 [Pleurotus eryngii]